MTREGVSSFPSAYVWQRASVYAGIPPPEVGGHRLTLRRSVGWSVSTLASSPVQTLDYISGVSRVSRWCEPILCSLNLSDMWFRFVNLRKIFGDFKLLYLWWITNFTKVYRQKCQLFKINNILVINNEFVTIVLYINYN